ncbi:hypothetical protein PTTG_09892 [Puccinia triticina 1-1 BBBD Race 1]|uniref:Glycosyltransferase family 49 protein n=2 Tax=Puccinia triticina TaxID=208348 RepID=A0A180GG00_PUCT1|nr:uncharacterized protein PtA15_5A873 [Puccinia triticina]OAV91620.1 hypothetical protein PTTG_09892 [Puccinia triticina 1-1 BBBD Race 1]WAQ85298.1 hypothetical protein PtA15_5A873 [Puccinia triticina]WAR58595.1 hypothetical protein PtB15_5B829 [Puccinia triticina]
MPLLTRLLKPLWTLYLLSAILYTTSVVVLFPGFRLLFQGIFNSHQSAGDPTFSALQTSTIQIVPRLLPNHHIDLHSLYHLKIRKNLKGTSVNTDEVIAEDDASLWTAKTGKVSLRVSSPTSFRRTADGRPIPPRSTLKGFDPSLSDKVDWHPVGHNLSGQAASRDHLLQSARKETHSTTEDFFLSKAFSDSLGPSKIIPFFYKAIGPDQSGVIDPKDISITTLVTSNRFKVFAKLVENYQGPISATIHVSDSPGILQPLLDSLDELYHSSKSMSTWVDIHLVVDSFDRQFNMWRNVAKFFARTDYVMMLDVDFWICTDFRRRILDSPELMDQLAAGTSAFVIPAFEYTKQSDGVDPDGFPSDKQALMKLVSSGQIGMFHKSWMPGHGSTNYTRFYIADQLDQIYPASGYSHSYEPYVVYKKDKTPYCDERFIGYGANKAACIFELYLSGVSFYVLPQDFLIHQSHAYAEKTRHHERRFNRKLYSDFREEVCFRYFNEFLKLGVVHEKGQNMLGECKRIRGFAEAAARLGQANLVSINFKK